MLCKDKGFCYYPDFPPPYRFCGCGAAKTLKEDHPEIVDEANAQAAKLGLFAKKA
jgi:hypothetical protein